MIAQCDEAVEPSRPSLFVDFTACVGEAARAAVCRALEGAGIEAADAARGLASVVVFRNSLDAALDAVRERCLDPCSRVLVLALDGASLTTSDSFRLLRAGALDVSRFDPDGEGIRAIAARVQRFLTVDAILASAAVRTTLIGSSDAWLRALRQLVEVALFTDVPLLITGETGTGKELAARLVHALDARKTKGDFVVLDCTTIAPELSGSEFFGHEKGSFTGAVCARNGAFALADGGTLFLDEIGDLPLPLQGELLRVTQERTYKRVGGNVWHSTDFRLLCATHRDLDLERRERRFRSDLFYRLAGWTIELPALRERTQDVIPLVDHFLSQSLGFTPPLEDAVRRHLMGRSFPGNVRELRQLAQRIAKRHVGIGPITVGDLDRDACHADASDQDWCGSAFQRSIGRAVAMGIGLKEIGRMAEDMAVRLAVSSENGSLQAAARRLGVTDRALQLRRASQRVSEVPKSLAAEADDGVPAR